MRSDRVRVCFVGLGAHAALVMSRLYASVRGTTVLQEKQIPNRSEKYDGLVRLFNLPVQLCNEVCRRALLVPPAKQLGKGPRA